MGVSVVVILAATLVVAVAAGGRPAPPLAAPVQPRYPDLGMAPLTDIVIGTEQGSGRVFLRFSATLINVGAGPLMVVAFRPFLFSDDWSVVQRIDDAIGGYSERDAAANLVYAGDGHEHWHLAGAAAHQLETTDGVVVASLVKTGFCFFDNVRNPQASAGTPPAPVYLAAECGDRGDREVAMGLSVDWGDEYQWYLLNQTIEITTIADGPYRLRAIADPADRFLESDETNNDISVVVDLSTTNGARHVDIVDAAEAGAG